MINKLKTEVTQSFLIVMVLFCNYHVNVVKTPAEVNECVYNIFYILLCHLFCYKFIN